jgi:hypothetical protein
MGICDEQRREQRRKNNVSRLDISHRLVVDSRKRDERLEAKATFRTMPKVTNFPLIMIIRPFRGDQLIIALNAGHPKFGTTIGKHRRHGNLPHSPSLWFEVVTGL